MAADLKARYGDAVRLYAALSPAQQQALWHGQPLAVARMTAAQRDLFATALMEFHQRGSDPPSVNRMAAGWRN